MRHKHSGRRLGRTGAHRTAMFRNMVTSLFEHERIVTTHEKAKELRPIAEKMITLAKRGDMHARRQALSYIRSKDVVHKLFSSIKDQFADRNGGYTRILQTGVRRGDAASMAIIELVGYQEQVAAVKEAKDN
ncbi:50S ribosomal protein L17 [Desulfopila aestuarii]|uniref:Large ribosomal subunit protein bL17 n=1 Tax=Desulfopila aestuarii DSM 18488 TaxID=1121416 RepID=A0A1M7Y077_9BACT|nr:50S ribosomal protein L17 [Desulfopila aestuarii]SHO44909.1 LSU ribosomal protein L17P [Desulfopila aestuarii DSM 18488]